MILFERDWERYPYAIVDTSQDAWVRLAGIYREMGVKNHNFILQLHNKDLLGRDPYKPSSPEEAIAVALECKDNFWYFMRYIARDPEGSADHPLPFVPNRGIVAAYWLYFNHITFFLIMIRQTGKSFGLDWLYTYLLNIAYEKSEISVLTKDEKLCSRELERLKSMELVMPDYLKQRSTRDPGNTELIRISSLSNVLRFYLPNKSPKLADTVGRGMTTPTAGVDEFAYIHNNSITIPVMLSATLAARELARTRCISYGTIFATTSGKRNTPEGKYAYRLVSESAVMSEHFYDADNLEHLEQIVINASPSKKLRVAATYNHRQLGKTDKWLKERLEASIQEDPVQIEADFFNRWPAGTDALPFSKEIADLIFASEVNDPYVEISGDAAYALRWYYSQFDIPRKMQQPHILAIDPSDAIGRDAIGIVMLNVSTGEVAMATTVAKTNLIQFSMWVCDFMQQYPKITCIMERRGSGATILDYLLMYLPTHDINPFTRLYNSVVQHQDEKPEQYRAISGPSTWLSNNVVEYKSCFGWATSGSGTTSRTSLYSKTLSTATSLGCTTVRDRTLILQILGLVIRNGRIDHEEGEHDDMVIAYLLGWWLLTQGKYLTHYGIEPRSSLSSNDRIMQQRQHLSLYDHSKHIQAKQEIERLTKELESEQSPYIIARLESDLKRYVDLLPPEEKTIFSVDDLINTINEKRKTTVNPYFSSGYSSGSSYQSSYSSSDWTDQIVYM